MLLTEIYVWLVLSVLIILIFFEKLLNFFVKRLFIFPINIFKRYKEKINLNEIKKEFIDNKTNSINIEKTGDIPQTTTKVDNELTKIKFEKLQIHAKKFKEKWDIHNYEKKLVESLVLIPENIDVLDQLVNLYCFTWKTKKAFSLLKKLIQLDTNNHKAIWQLSKIYLENSETETALLIINKVLELKKDNPRYRMTKAEILYNKDNIQEAINCSKQALKQRPDNIMYLESVATLYEELWETKQSKKYWLKILDIEPNYETARERFKEL